jgi:hypothetical protein
MANAWLRLYAEFQSDPKVQMMSEAMQRRLVMLFCARCSDMLHDDELALAFLLRISQSELADTKALFIEKGFIDETWDLLNWDKRQFQSDSSTERVRKHRNAMKQDETLQERSGNVSETDRTEQNRKNRTENALSPEATNETLPKVKPEEFADIWNRTCKKLPKIRAFTPSRRKQVLLRMKEGVTLEIFAEAIKCCTEKRFLRGEGNRHWTATFDWLFENDRNIHRVIEEDWTVGKSDKSETLDIPRRPVAQGAGEQNGHRPEQLASPRRPVARAGGTEEKGYADEKEELQ